MTDYQHGTGSSGTMMIRDLSSSVEFWLNSNNSTTFNHELPYGWTVNGSTGSSTFNYNAGAGWQRLRTFTVTTSQTVTFRLGSTGTSGLGGPTTFSHSVTRTGVPSPPGTPTISNIRTNAVFVTFVDSSNGGATIDVRQIGYDTNPNPGTPKWIVGYPTGGVTLFNLTPATTYYVWARTHNSRGYSGWGGRAQVTTLAAARINVGGTWKTAIPYVRVGGVWKQAVPWVCDAGVWKETI